MKKIYLLTAVLAFVGGFVVASYAYAKDSSQDPEATFKVKQSDFFLVHTVTGEARDRNGARDSRTDVYIYRLTNKVVDRLTGDLVGFEVITNTGETKIIPSRNLANYKLVRTQNLAGAIKDLPKENFVEPSWGTFLQSLAEGQADPDHDLTAFRKIYKSITERANFTETYFAQQLEGRTVEVLDQSNAAKTELEKLRAEAQPKPIGAPAEFKDLGRSRAKDVLIAR